MGSGSGGGSYGLRRRRQLWEQSPSRGRASFGQGGRASWGLAWEETLLSGGDAGSCRRDNNVPGAAAWLAGWRGKVTQAQWVQPAGVTVTHTEFLPWGSPGVGKAAHNWMACPSPTAWSGATPVASPGRVSGMGFCGLEHLACFPWYLSAPRSLLVCATLTGPHFHLCLPHGWNPEWWILTS